MNSSLSGPLDYDKTKVIKCILLEERTIPEITRGLEITMFRAFTSFHLSNCCNTYLILSPNGHMGSHHHQHKVPSCSCQILLNTIHLHYIRIPPPFCSSAFSIALRLMAQPLCLGFSSSLAGVTRRNLQV